jgi:hypothetical protein
MLREEPTTSDLERGERLVGAINARDFDAMASSEGAG